MAAIAHCPLLEVRPPSLPPSLSFQVVYLANNKITTMAGTSSTEREGEREGGTE